MNGYSALTIPAAFPVRETPSPSVRVGTGWLLLPAAAQLLSSATSRSLLVTEGRHRLVLLVLVCGLFGIIVPTEIAADSEMFVSRTILSIPPHYALTAFTVALALLADARYYARVLTRPLVAVGLVFLSFALINGAIRYGFRSYLVRSDIYIIRWFIVGFMLMRLAIAAGMLRPYLVFAAIVILLTAYGIDTKNTEGGEVNTAIKRATSSNLWPVINCGTIMIGLLLTVAWPRSWFYATISTTAFAANFFAGSIRTSTRSMFVVQAISFVLILIALGRDPRMRGRGQGLRRVAVGGAVVAVLLLVYQIGRGELLGGYSQIADRLRDTSVESGTGGARIHEALDMLQKMEPDEWVLGRGLGGMFYSTLGAWFNVPHIAVLGWLQKGGLVVFGWVLLTVYIAPTLAFFRQLARPRQWSSLPPPILIVGPMLVSWCVLTLISGGIDIGSFLGLGGLTALWMQLADDDQVFQASRRGASPARPGQRVHVGL